MSEQDLAKPVVKWLTAQHWEVYQEVKFDFAGGIADIVAVRGKLIWVIECKTSLSLAVLEQAHNWHTPLRSVAVPMTRKRRGIIYPIARDYLRVGIIEVDIRHRDWGLSDVGETLPSPILREHYRYSQRYLSSLREEQKTYCEAGSSRGGYFTPYKQTMNSVRRFITLNPGCSLKEIMDGIEGHHYSSDKSARSSIPYALHHYENDWCEIKEVDRKCCYFVRGLV